MIGAEKLRNIAMFEKPSLQLGAHIRDAETWEISATEKTFNN